MTIGVCRLARLILKNYATPKIVSRTLGLSGANSDSSSVLRMQKPSLSIGRRKQQSKVRMLRIILHFSHSMDRRRRIGIRCVTNDYRSEGNVLMLYGRLSDTAFGIRLLHTDVPMEMVRNSSSHYCSLCLYIDICILGVYFSKNAAFSIGNYSRATTNAFWGNSCLDVKTCVTMAELINLPARFVSTNPHFVVENTEWIAW